MTHLSFDQVVEAGCLPITPPAATTTARLDRDQGAREGITFTFVVTRPVGQTVATTIGTVASGPVRRLIVNQTGVFPTLRLRGHQWRNGA
ncbi:hypothetical protein [Streptomyces sp. NPDC001770]